MAKHSKEVLRRANYELFISTLTTLSLLNLVLVFFYRDPDIVEVLLRINILISLILFIDFLVRLRAADSRRTYFIKRYGWLDLIGSLPVPGAQLARLPRLVVTIKVLRQTGEKNILREVISNRADTALLSIALFVILLLEFGSIGILRAEESAAEANITTAGDAIWWVLVTISTVGYGDFFPVSERGRFVGLFVIIAGVGVFGTLSGYLAKIFLGESEQKARQQAEIVQGLMQEIKQLQQEQMAMRQAQEEINFKIQDRLATIESLLRRSVDGGPKS